MLFAEIEATGWVLIITAGGGFLLDRILTYLREKRKETEARDDAAAKLARDEAVAAKVSEVAAQAKITAEKAAQAATKVEEVKTTLNNATKHQEERAIYQEEKIDEMAKVGAATHTLVNSNYGASLMATLLALKNVRLLTTKPEDIGPADAAVVEAQRLYDDHVAKQAKVDNTKAMEAK